MGLFCVTMLCVIPLCVAVCPNSWLRYEQSCYHVGHTSFNFLDSQRHCEHYGASLVNLETRDEIAFLRGYLMLLSDQKHWIGLSDEETEGIWKWYPSEKRANVTDWQPNDNEPNGGIAANCAAIWAGYNYHWVDDSCSERYPPVCELVDEQAVIVG
ncbi:perlucin-like isoform X1 [Dreissena polymorpha]|uniref:C-type lectin domain-containing protein n=1 Tax=Dreissena polymorpha TaxID=45954 RepID=A0A9D4I8L9_DREPO|nr:perlucin-like [Dreissena polymorpha]XP_052236432.1 perlucin-like isoform X1 [Dreissena polymorpha]KAH3752121.1 hypothetical protein DPMN_186732 [Dreissena polymorpha]KAH3752334.1 hypothetical protein DPMN_186950 [Dreissena polymorpha]